MLFEVKLGDEWVLIGSETLTVKLTGNRTRGTFEGIARTPGKDRISGSFRC